MEEGVQFDCCIGVSAGSANMCSYVAGQHGRNKPFYQDYSFRKEYMSVGNLVRKHSYLDLEYVYGALSNRGGENPLDYPAVVRSPAELVIVATEARTGKPRYFTKADLRQDDYRPLMASCCIPVVDQPYFMDGVPYYDGGLADPVPLEKAFALGCDRVAANGDFANKIGTSVVAAVAKQYGVPVYICAPTSTIDMATVTGADICIEQRKAEEVTEMWYKERMAPEGVKVYNPAFDVTDHELIAGIVTEYGVARAPYTESLKEIMERKAQRG